MEKQQLTLCNLLILFLIIFTRMGAHAASVPYTQPQPPRVASKAHILIDADSGKILAEKNAQQKIAPASLTKMMTMYVISNALKSGEIRLDDEVRVSKKAWKMGGSKMFIRAGQRVKVRDLILGIIVDSGNDACVAMAEHLGGSEQNFAMLMNKYAQALGMHDSHFTDSTGLPDKDHYSTAADLAILAQALINEFPENYTWYKKKWFTFNKIKQPNRNRLLWRDNSVDGLKTGHTNEAGYCLVASAKKENMRLISVLLGAPNETSREDSSERLLSYGFRFYQTHKLYDNTQPITRVRVWKGAQKELELGIGKTAYITIPKGQYNDVKVSTLIANDLTAPIEKGSSVGRLKITLDNQTLLDLPLVALEDIKQGSLLGRFSDGIRMKVSRWLS